MEKHEYLEVAKGKLITDGLTFDEAQHRYFYRGKELSGITGKISKRLGKNFSSTFVEEGRAEGTHVHKAIEYWIRFRGHMSVHPAARWAIGELEKYLAKGYKIYAEVLISDFDKHASSIDILLISPTGEVIIIDTKAGNFSRSYVEWQLGIYKEFLERSTRYKVMGAKCLSTKDKMLYTIAPRQPIEVDAVLYN